VAVLVGITLLVYLGRLILAVVLAVAVAVEPVQVALVL
jgi:hypothetical protein